jgi:hypothetical protein
MHLRTLNRSVRELQMAGTQALLSSQAEIWHSLQMSWTAIIGDISSSAGDAYRSPEDGAGYSFW